MSPADEELIGSFATPASSWSPAIRMWGEEDGNRVHVVLKGDAVAEVSARLDAREVDERFVAGVVALANHWDCVIVTDRLEVVAPLEGELLAALEDSDARRFVRDPRKYFDTFEEGRQGDPA